MTITITILLEITIKTEQKNKEKQAGAELCQAQLPTGILLNCD